MKRINGFFEEMKTYFLEKDLDSFNEIKEDLLEQIEIQLEEGKTEEEIIAGLGKPEMIADSFYEDQRLDKALKAEKDIVAVEDVKKVYKKEQQLKRKKVLKKIQLAIFIAIGLLCLALSIYLIGFVFVYSIFEKYFAFGPATLAVFFLCSLIYFIWKIRGKQFVHNKWLGMISMISLVSSIGIFFSGQWFYEGSYYDKTIELTDFTSKEALFLSQYPVDITVIPIAEGEAPKVEIEGYMKKSDQLQLVKEEKKTTRIQIGSGDHFDVLKKMKKSDVVFYLPRQKTLGDVSFKIKHGTVMLSHLHANKLGIKIESGELRLNDIYSTTIDITSKNADTTINNFYSDIKIYNDHGKSIVKEGQGIVEISSKTGLINLSDLTSRSTVINNRKGKNVVNSSVIKTLTALNIEGTTIIENQTGRTKIKNTDGKIVLTDLQGELDLKNQHGQVIVYEKDPLDAVVTSNTGIVKWVQNYKSAVEFNLSSKSGKIINEFENNKESSNKITITTQTGDIRIIEKDESN
ncbi:DUF4097 family beta strand repeat-containing protein [Enterococcus wangshanyuanii]|uniref:DUF4097 domain-containing protein n=1 Tax=Enterococcus wangshanyuanii TaxID=2005703 RepID=A0ABQ1NH43_9ENTE|nr:DUF4097 family beta strand repeat-containing protein [Enterococcus wangshanyuanii]GGC77035.1 hypothetical protein GCM10011573_03340 [Enterococcus wangshanyuanii]